VNTFPIHVTKFEKCPADMVMTMENITLGLSRQQEQNSDNEPDR